MDGLGCPGVRFCTRDGEFHPGLVWVPLRGIWPRLAERVEGATLAGSAVPGGGDYRQRGVRIRPRCSSEGCTPKILVMPPPLRPPLLLPLPSLLRLADIIVVLRSGAIFFWNSKEGKADNGWEIEERLPPLFMQLVRRVHGPSFDGEEQVFFSSCCLLIINFADYYNK